MLLSCCELISCEQQQYVITLLLLDNGTLVPVARSPPPTSYTLSTKVIAALFLFLVFFISFSANVILISTVGSSLTLRRIPHNILILQLGVCGLVESVLNIGLSTGYLLTQPWRLGRIVCQCNAFLMEVLPMVYTLSLMILVINRTMALRQHLSTATKYRKIDGKIGRMKIVITLVWLLSVLLSSPVLVGIVEPWPFPARYSCHPAHPWAPLYGLVSAGSGFLLPWLALLLCSAVIFRTVKVSQEVQKISLSSSSSFQKEKKREEIDKRGQIGPANKLATNTAMLMASNQMWHEMKNIVLISSLMILYIVLLGPYIILIKSNHIYQHWSPYDLELYRNLSTSYYEEESPPNVSSLAPVSRSRDLAPTTNLTLHDPGIWEVPEIKENTNDAETVFVWLRYIHCALVPLTILVLNKDIRQKALDLVLCCRRARSSSVSPRPISALLHRQNLEYNRRHQKKKYKLCDYHVPVLFATQEGLYLRILDGELSEPSKEGEEQEVNKNMWTLEPQFSTELCDLKIETQTSVTHHLNPADSVEDHHHQHQDHDEAVHEDLSQHEKKEKKKVHFRNTVLEIGKHVEEFESERLPSGEQREFRDIHDRKMTGVGNRLHSQDDGSHSSRSHRKHRRHSFNPEVGGGGGGHKRSHRRNSQPLEELHLLH